MEWLQTLLDNSTTPVLTAFLLGLFTALSPCPLATNITAIGYIGRDLTSHHRIFINGLLYTLGRILTYTIIGCILIPLLREGASIYVIQKFLGRYGEMLVGPALVIIGLYMLWGDRLNLPKFGFGGQGSEQVSHHGGCGALLLGVLFALAFCPTSGIFYFGMLIPMAAGQSGGYLLPVVFAVATGAPVVVVAWLLAYSVSGIGKFYSKMQTFQKWMNLIIALLFIGVGIYYIVLLWL